MGLDFSRIYQISNTQQPEKERISQPEQMQNFIRLDAVSDINKKNLEMYQDYQHNILAAGTLTSEITKGLQQGKPIASLFLQAMKAISLMTGDEFTYQNTAELLQSVYGFGLHEPEAEAMTAENIRKRLEKLNHSLETAIDSTDRAHIQNAIKAHEKKLALLNQQNFYD